MNYTEIQITSGGQTITFTPASMKPQYESISKDSSGRDANGDMHIEWIRKNNNPSAVPAFEITLPPHRVGDLRYNKILSYVLGRQYQMRYYDYLAGDWKTLAFYTSGASFDWYSGIILDGIVTGATFKATSMTNVEYPNRSGIQLAAPVITLSGTAVSWSAISHATSYDVYDSAVGVVNQSGTTYTIRDGYDRSIYVIAKTTQSGYSDSPMSNIVTFSAGTPLQVQITSEDSAKGSASGGGIYVTGQVVTATATARQGYQFSGWYNGTTLVSSNNPYTFTVSSGVTLTAKFMAASNYTVNIICPSGPTYTLNGTTYSGNRSITVTPNQVITLIPAQLYGTMRCTNLIVNGVVTHFAEGEGLVKTITADTTITIEYSSGYTRILVNIENGAEVYVAGNEMPIANFPATVRTKGSGDIVTLTATGGSGGTFDHWDTDVSPSVFDVNPTINVNVDAFSGVTFIAVAE